MYGVDTSHTRQTYFQMSWGGRGSFPHWGRGIRDWMAGWAGKAFGIVLEVSASSPPFGVTPTKPKHAGLSGHRQGLDHGDRVPWRMGWNEAGVGMKIEGRGTDSIHTGEAGSEKVLTVFGMQGGAVCDHDIGMYTDRDLCAGKLSKVAR